MRHALLVAPLAFILSTLSSAPAQARDVALGAAVGGAFSITQLRELHLERAGNSFSWGFFVDIPLAETFFITPAAMLYELDFGTGAKPVTDIDLAFKFVAPIAFVRLGVGALGGLTSAELKYRGHVGALAHLGFLLGTSFEAFVQFQYKRVFRDPQDIDDLHGYAGGMLHL